MSEATCDLEVKGPWWL